MAAANRRWVPVVPTWQRTTTLVVLLLLGWAVLLPPGRTPLWWHYAGAAGLVLAFLSSWHGQHVSTGLRRWAPMAGYNRRLRRDGTLQARQPVGDGTPEPSPARMQGLEAELVIHLQPHPHALVTAGDTADQLPWEFVTRWLDRYGVRADELTITAATRTPPASGLRTDAAQLLGGPITQHRDTWLTYTLRADSNVAALTARRTTVSVAESAGDDGGDDDEGAPRPMQRAVLADTVARRLVAELRELGWLATLADSGDRLPRFVPPGATVRREWWSATEYADGFRAVYAVNPRALATVLAELPKLPTKATWVAVTITAQGRRPATMTACVGTLTGLRPARTPLPGLQGRHGLHRRLTPLLGVGGLNRDAQVALPAIEVDRSDLTPLRWPTAATGVPIGFNRYRQPVYLGLTSPEPVRITVIGTPEFHVGIVSRLALSGLPVVVHTVPGSRSQWAGLAAHGAPQQFSTSPTPPSSAIVVTDDGSATPSVAITVVLRHPGTRPPATTIVIVQDAGQPALFHVTTPRSGELLSTRVTSAG